jgi:hypothetical protein
MFNKPDPLALRDVIDRENTRKRDEAGQRRKAQSAFRKARKAHSRNSVCAFVNAD